MSPTTTSDKPQFTPLENDRYRAILAERLEEIGVLWLNQLYSNWDGAGCKEIFRIIHNVRGSASLFHQTEIVNIAGQLEKRLVKHMSERMAPSIEQKEEIAHLIAQLRSEANLELDDMPYEETMILSERSGFVDDDVSYTEHDVSNMALIYIVDDDPIQLHYLEQQIATHGYEVRTFITLNALEEAFQKCQPHVIIADIIFPEGNLAGVTKVSALNNKYSTNIPVIYISSRMDITARLIAKRSGGSGYLMKPVNIPAMLLQLKEFTQTEEQHEDYRVLIVDDDEVAATFYSLSLQRLGIQTQVIYKAINIIQAMIEFQPELILLDFHLPECTGMELVEMIRQEATFSALPTYVVSSETSKEVQLQTLQAGADDFLLKPVDTKWLAPMIKSRIKRERDKCWRSNFVSQRDGVSGLHNRNWFQYHLSNLIGQGSLSQGGIINIQLDNYSELRNLSNVEQIIADLAYIIFNCSQREDSLARFSESSFMLLASRDHWDDFNEIAQHIHQSIADYSISHNTSSLDITASIGISVTHGMEANSIISEVEEVTFELIKTGGDGVMASHYLTALLETKEPDKDKLKLLFANAKQGKIQFVFQPIVAVNDDNIDRYEVMLRLSEEAEVMLPNHALLRAVEQAGLTTKLDHDVISQSLKVISSIEKKKMNLLFIHISATSLKRRQVYEMFKQCLMEQNLSGDMVIAMLPTDQVWKSIPYVKKLSQKLHELGIDLCLDQFGKKENDTQILQQFDVDYVKFAPSIVRQPEASEGRQERLMELVSKVKAHGSKSILGFIENADTLRKIWSINPEYLQGNYVQAAEKSMIADFQLDTE